MAEKEYIEREAVLAYMSEVKAACISNFEDEASAVIAGMIGEIKDDEIPAADVEPVRHGHWKKGKGYERPTENGFVHDDKYICDCCGWGCCCDTKLDFCFCPNCGAKMDGGEQK